MKKFHANLDISLGKESLCSNGVLTSANEGYLATSGRVFLKERKNTPFRAFRRETTCVQRCFYATQSLASLYFSYQQLA